MKKTPPPIGHVDRLSIVCSGTFGRGRNAEQGHETTVVDVFTRELYEDDETGEVSWSSSFGHGGQLLDATRDVEISASEWLLDDVATRSRWHARCPACGDALTVTWEKLHPMVWKMLEHGIASVEIRSMRAYIGS